MCYRSDLPWFRSQRVLAIFTDVVETTGVQPRLKCFYACALAAFLHLVILCGLISCTFELYYKPISSNTQSPSKQPIVFDHCLWTSRQKDYMYAFPLIKSIERVAWLMFHDSHVRERTHKHVCTHQFFQPHIHTRIHTYTHAHTFVGLYIMYMFTLMTKR